MKLSALLSSLSCAAFCAALLSFQPALAKTDSVLNTPCSGDKGGISQCKGKSFVCRDGTVSESTQNCQTYMKEQQSKKSSSSSKKNSSDNLIQNEPCSGNKGGIDYCDGKKFVCNDGTVSQSTQNCQTYVKENGKSGSKSSKKSDGSDNLIQNTPCSGSKGGISYCKGVQFVCKDGTVSSSEQNCRTYDNGRYVKNSK